MEPITIGLIGLAVLVTLIALRVPIAYAMILVGAVGISLLNGTAILLNQLKDLAYGQFSIYDLSVVPLFILMGAIASRSSLSGDLFRAANAWLGWMRGGVAVSYCRLRRVRCCLRQLPCHGIDKGAGGLAGASAIQLFGYARDGNDRRGRCSWHPYPAFRRFDHLRDYR